MSLRGWWPGTPEKNSFPGGLVPGWVGMNLFPLGWWPGWVGMNLFPQGWWPGWVGIFISPRLVTRLNRKEFFSPRLINCSFIQLGFIPNEEIKKTSLYLNINFDLWFEWDHFTNTLPDNVNPLVWKNRDGEISPVVTQAHFIFPSHGLAVMVKKNFPSRGSAAPGEIFLHQSC